MWPCRADLQNQIKQFIEYFSNEKSTKLLIYNNLKLIIKIVERHET